MHRAAPQPAATPRSEVAAPITIAPANATAHPARSVRGKPSRSMSPASSAMNTGPTLTSIAAVPASTRCSAAMSITLYAPNHSSANRTSRGTSARGGSTSRRTATTAPSTAAATTSRPSDSGPAPIARPASRMPTNADAHRVTVTSAAASARRSAAPVDAAAVAGAAGGTGSGNVVSVTCEKTLRARRFVRARSVGRDNGPMHGDADIASIASVIGHPAHGRMLTALFRGPAMSASELAAEAGVTASTASAHLARLTDSGLVVAERDGRRRLHRLADERVAEVIEGLALIAPSQQIRTLRAGNRAAAERAARSCYDHLAGAAGVALTERLCALGALGADSLHVADPT